MNTITRNGKRWTVNECIQLQREFELLELSVSEIAIKHKRTPNAIMFKLDQEGFEDYNVLYNNHYNLNSQIPSQITNKYEGDSITNDNDSITNDNDSITNDNDYITNDNDYITNDDDDDDDDNYNDDQDDLKEHVMRLEKQVMALTEMFMKSTKSKSLFSLFS